MCSFSTHRTWPARNIVISFWPSRLLSSCGRNSTSPARPCSGLTAVSRKCRCPQAPMGRLRTGRRRTEEGPMADRRFFDNAGPFALSELATIAEAELAPGADGARRFANVAPLDVAGPDDVGFLDNRRSEEHTSELQSLMRTSYAVFCLKKNKTDHLKHTQH